MAARKYYKDYVLEQEYNPRTGKMKKVSRYIGPTFVFTYPEKIPGAKILFTVLSAVMTLAFFTMMFVNAPCGHAFYVMVPLVISLLFYFFMWASVLRLFTAKKPVNREHKDKIEGRFKMVSVVIMILTGIAFIGHVVYSCLFWQLLNSMNRIFEILFYIMKAVILAAAFVMFRKSSILAMQETEKD